MRLQKEGVSSKVALGDCSCHLCTLLRQSRFFIKISVHRARVELDVAERSGSSSVVSVIQHRVHEDQKPLGKSPLGWEALQELSYVHKSLSGCGASGAELPSCGCSSARTTACVLSLTGKKFSHGLTKASKICLSIYGQFNEPIHPEGLGKPGSVFRQMFAI